MGFLGRVFHRMPHIQRALATTSVAADIFWPRDPGNDLFVLQVPVWGFDLERIKDCDVMVCPTTHMLTLVAKKSVPAVENGPVALGPLPAEPTRPTGLLAADFN